MESIIHNITWLAICLYHEARGECPEGRIAVCHVIMNRVQWAGKDVDTVVLKPWQFSWANKGNRPAIDDYEAFIHCMESAMACLSQRLQGKNLGRADHYFADYIEPPNWSDSMVKIAKIGKHIFFRSQ